VVKNNKANKFLGERKKKGTGKNKGKGPEAETSMACYR
jgi:hypothetical protein